MEETQTSTLPLPPRYLEALRQTPQNPRYHAEGNVLIHTEMVLQAYRDHADEFDLSEADHEVLYWAAVLHDIGKPDVTRWNKTRWSAHGHERAGVPIARDILLQHPEISSTQRKRILDLVKYHAVPLQWGLHRRALEAYKRLATRTDLRLLGIFSYFDIIGRYCEDKPGVLDLIRHFNRQIVPRIHYEMGTYGCMQKHYAQVSLSQKNALWNSLSMTDVALLEKLLYTATPRTAHPRFTAVIPIGMLTPVHKDKLGVHYPGFLSFDASSLRLNVADVHTREAQLRKLKHFVSVYGRAGKNLLIEGLPLRNGIRVYLANYLRQQGAWVEYIFVERTQEDLAEQAEAHTPDFDPIEWHDALDYPHPWEAHRIRHWS